MHHSKLCINHHSCHTMLLVQETPSKVEGFFDDACYQFYLRRLFHSLGFFQVTLHAYALLPDQIWLLVTPRTRFAARALLVSVNRAYGEYFNTRFSRRCKPWSSPLHQIPAQTAGEVLVCQKLVECEPLNSGCVQQVGSWRWSSYAINAFGSKHRFVTRHPAVSAFLQQAPDPGSAYREYVRSRFARGQYEYLRTRIARNQPLQGSVAISCSV